MGFPLHQASPQRPGKGVSTDWAPRYQRLCWDVLSSGIFTVSKCIFHSGRASIFSSKLRKSLMFSQLAHGDSTTENGVSVYNLFFLTSFTQTRMLGEDGRKRANPLHISHVPMWPLATFCYWKLLCSKALWRWLFLCQPLNVWNCSFSPCFISFCPVDILVHILKVPDLSQPLCRKDGSWS